MQVLSRAQGRRRASLASLIALAMIGGATATTRATPILAVDINDRSTNDAAHQQAGFAYFLMAGTTAASSVLESNSLSSDGGANTYTVTMQAFDDHLDENTVTTGIQDSTGQIDDRARATPTNGGSLTTAALYQDLIFAGTSVGPTGGIDLKITGGQLQPNTNYLVSFYDFDSGSTAVPQPRTANWLDGNNSDALVVTTTFNAASLPTTDDQYKFTGLARTDGSGGLFLKGRNTTPNSASGATNIGVILNGFEINTPEPASLSLIGIAGITMLRRGRLARR